MILPAADQDQFATDDFREAECLILGRVPYLHNLVSLPRAQDLAGNGQIPPTLDSNPHCLRTGRAIVFASEVTSRHGDPCDDLGRPG